MTERNAFNCLIPLRAFLLEDDRWDRAYGEAVGFGIEALRKQIPKPANYAQDREDAYCPVCDSCVQTDNRRLSRLYCDECGQKLLWEEEND